MKIYQLPGDVQVELLALQSMAGFEPQMGATSLERMTEGDLFQMIKVIRIALQLRLEARAR